MSRGIDVYQMTLIVFYFDIHWTTLVDNITLLCVKMWKYHEIYENIAGVQRGSFSLELHKKGHF